MLNAAAFSKLESQFKRVFGDDVLDSLRAAVTNRPVVTIGGDQLTGKSTLANKLATHFEGTTESAGTIFRAEAKRRGISCAALSREALDDPRIDINIDYNLCLKVATGLPDRILFLEGRQPALMASYMAACMGKKRVHKIYLSCGKREQALRFLDREVSPEVKARADALIPRDQSFDQLASITPFIQRLDDGKEAAEADEESAALTVAWADFADNESRDKDDLARYAELYHFVGDLTYQNMELYDTVIDTAPLDIDGVFAAAAVHIKKE